MEGENGNGRVTLAVLSTKLDNLTEKVTLLTTDHESRLRAVEGLQTTHSEQIKNICQDQDDLRGRVNTWSGVNSFGALLAVILSYLGLSK